MYVLGRGVIAHSCFACLRCVLRGNRVESRAQLRAFLFCENLCGNQSGRVRFAGGYLFFQKPPVKDNRSLPCFEFRIQRLPEAAPWFSVEFGFEPD
jgi:hypothetical protein